MRRNKGFTLIEIMAVMAIILILIGFIMPALTSARRQARKMECLSNLRQIGVAMQAYAMDHGGKFPNDGTWITLIDGYFDDGNVPSCPEFATHASGDGYTMTSDCDEKLVEACVSNSPLVQDTTSLHSGNTKNILYADGHVATQ